MQSHPVPLSEYELIGLLRKDGFAEETFSGDNLALYQTHFLVMNALYQLRTACLNDGYFLQISALNIALEPVATKEGTTLTNIAAGDEDLSEYYLDWRNFKISDDKIESLLMSFWQRFHAPDDIARAFQVLGLPATASGDEVVAAYRRSAAEHHPDRGGDASQFLLIREAYEILRGAM